LIVSDAAPFPTEPKMNVESREVIVAPARG
jgi:hypothetical protein